MTAPTTMHALVFDDALRYSANVPVEIREGEALVKMRLAGICNTDIEISRGYMGFRGIPGHEFVGEVVDASDGALVGRRVVGEINAVCGSCSRCASGAATHCVNRTVLGILNRSGVFAEYVSLPEANLHPVSDGLPDERAVFVEPVAAAFRILEQINVRRSHRVVVLGDGKLGLLVAQVLTTTGAHVMMVGRHPKKLATLDRMSIERRLTTEQLPHDADIVVDCTGSSSGLELALSMVRPLGTLVLKSTVADSRPYNLAPVVVDEVQVVGSRCGPFEPAITALTEGSVRVDHMIDSVYPLERGVEAFARAQEPGVLKVLLRC